MELALEIAGILILFAVFAVAACKLAAKSEASSRAVAPGNLRDASENEIAFFKKYYCQTGRIISSEKYKAEVEKMSETLKIAEGTLVRIHPGVECRSGDDPGSSTSTPTVDIRLGDQLLEHKTVTNTLNKTDVEQFQIGSPMLAFCAIDESGVNKVITLALKSYVSEGRFNESF